MQHQPDDPALIRQLIDAFVAAIRARDVERVMAVFARDVVSFDFGPPLHHGGGETFHERWRELFSAYEGAIDYEVRDLEIVTGAAVAFSHSLNRVGGTLMNGRRSDRWVRWTACYRKAHGQWLIVHEHVSVPADVRSGRAMMELRPE